MIFLFIFATSKINLSENKKFVFFSFFLICKAPSSIPLYYSSTSTSKQCIIFQSTITVCVSSDDSKHQHQVLIANDFAESMHHFTKPDQRLSSQTLLCCFHIQIRIVSLSSKLTQVSHCLS